MSTSRHERAYHILKLCELGARNLEPDLNDVQDESMPQLVHSYNSLSRDLRCLEKQASALWKPEFERALNSCHSMRVGMVTEDEKEAIRGFEDKCMACGRTESNCRYSVDLAGSFNPKEWYKGPCQVVRQYAEYRSWYDNLNSRRVFTIHDCKASGELPSVDKGCFVVGQTCLRKAQLRFMIQTLILDECQNSDAILEDGLDDHDDSDDDEKRGFGDTLQIDTIYTVNKKRIEDFIQRKTKLELAVADEKRYVPEIPLDNVLWEFIDECRWNAARGSRKCLFEIAGVRARETLSCHHEATHQEGIDTEVESDDDDPDDDCGPSNVNRRVLRKSVQKRNKRPFVVDDKDSDDELSDDCGYLDGTYVGNAASGAGGGAGSSQSNVGVDKRVTRSASSKAKQTENGSPPRSTRAAAVGSASADAIAGGDTFEEESIHDNTEREAAAVQTSPTSPSRAPQRTSTTSASVLAKRQRASGTLSSRKEAIVQLMELQTRLARSNNHRDAAVCTNAILTLQELQQLNAELAHTV